MSTEQNTPENPYPIEVFTMTMEEYVKAVPDEKLRTAISGCVGRHVWDVCCKQWLEQLRVAQLENTAPCDYCDPAGYVHHNKYCPKHPRNNQPMSTEPNAAKFNEPIWDSRNSDEPVEQNAQRPSDDERRASRKYSESIWKSTEQPPSETGAVDVEADIYQCAALILESHYDNTSSASFSRDVERAEKYIKDSIVTPLTARITFLEEQLRQHDTKH